MSNRKPTANTAAGKVPPAVSGKPAANNARKRIDEINNKHKSDVHHTVADLVAIENNGQLLRYRVEGAQLIVLLVDGRKFYSSLVV